MARLVRVVPGQDPGFTRKRTSSGFRYVDPMGSLRPRRIANASATW